MRKWLQELISLRDVFVFGGLALVGSGLWMLLPASALIVVGGILFHMGMRGGRSGNS